MHFSTLRSPRTPIGRCLVRTRTGVAWGLMAITLLAITSQPAQAIPAFARKYGLPCSACHEAWPKLNNFGQVFKDNGYQLENDRDSPIFQNNAYFPITFRITPQWHLEHTQRVQVDGPGTSIEQNITTSGFDLSGIDIWTAGTLYKNISFQVLPSSDATAAFHFESAWVRFDNLFGSHWLNLKFGKHELDTPISEKRFLFLTANGGFFQLYHFKPVGGPGLSSLNQFGGIGQNQLGVELMGHSKNSYTRYAVSLLSSNNGNVGLPTNQSYDVYLNGSQAFEAGRLGLQRVGAFAYVGRSPTYFLTNGGAAIPGTGRGDRSFYRVGAYGIWYLGKFDFSTLYMHGLDNAFLATNTPANTPLPTGSRSPTWNGGFIETHFTVNPQFIVVNRYEAIRVSRQAFTVLPGTTTTVPSDFGDIDAFSVGYRWYPIMFSRAGLAWHQEYSYVRSRKTSLVNNLDQGNSSLLMGFDFDF